MTIMGFPAYEVTQGQIIFDGSDIIGLTLTERARLVSDFKMEPFLDRDLHASLSGGEIKRAELFQLFITNPRLFMLDEPDS